MVKLFDCYFNFALEFVCIDCSAFFHTSRWEIGDDDLSSSILIVLEVGECYGITDVIVLACHEVICIIGCSHSLFEVDRRCEC